MSRSSATLLLLTLFTSVIAQQQCYFGPGAGNRGPNDLVPCDTNGQSACCLLGDTCLSGNTCYNYLTGDLYQYGCTDINYEDESCPYKCGFNTTLSPWTALEFCSDVQEVDDTWVCHAPESCGCEWNSTDSLLVLQPRGCKEMGTNARVALYAPSTLAPWISLPTDHAGSRTYYSGTTVNGTSTWVSTAIVGYTPAHITQLTTYGDQPSSPVLVVPGVSPAPSTISAAVPFSASATASSATETTSSTITSAPTSSTPTTSSPTTSTTAASSSGLSTGAKAGIGVGAAGGACLIAAVGICAFCWGRRQRKRRADGTAQQPQPQHNPQYPGSPPMQHQTSPYFGSPGDKPPGWQGGYPHQQSPYFAHQDPNAAYFAQHPHQQMYGVPSPPPQEYKAVQSPPMELSAEHPASEMESVGARSLGTPSPAYAEVGRPK